MKKIFLLIAAAAMIAVGCSKEDDTKKGKSSKEEEQKEYVAPITIDGDFADWAALDASKVATATHTDGSPKEALKTVKVYADEQFIFIYADFDLETDIKDPAAAWIPFHVYMNADNSATTGGYGDEFADADAEWMLETSITSYNPALFKWWGEVGANGWSWTDPSAKHDASDGWGAVIAEGQGIGSSAGSVSTAGKGTYEIQIIREMLAGVTFADTFTLGFDIQVDWSTVGILPNAKVTDENTNGLAPKLTVTTVK